MRNFVWLVPLSSFFACVGDPVLPTDSNLDVDGGAASTDASSSEEVPRLELIALPVTVLRGGQAAVRVRVIKRNGEPIPVLLQLSGGTPEFSLGTVVTLSPEQNETDIPFSVSNAVAFGSLTLQVVATAPELANPVFTEVAVQVRGEPGSLDSSFGIDGTAERPEGGHLRDLSRDAQGRMIAITGDSRVVKYDEEGRIDTTFGSNGVLNVPALASCTMSSSFSVTTTNQQWSVDGMCHYDDGLTLLQASGPYQAPYDIHFFPEVPSTSVTPYFFFEPMTRSLIREESGFMWAHGWNKDYGIKSSIRRYGPDGQPAVGWTSSGVEISDAPVTQEDDIVDVLTHQSTIFALGATRSRDANWNLLSENYFVVQLAHSNGARRRKDPLGEGFGSSLSAPGPQGEVFVARPSNRVCVTRIDATGATSLPPTCLRSTQVAHDTDAKVVRLRDGRLLVVSVGSDSKYWTLSADGEPESPLEGTSLPMGNGRSMRIVDVTEDAHRRLIISGSASGRTGEERWTIKRFWL